MSPVKLCLYMYTIARLNTASLVCEHHAFDALPGIRGSIPPTVDMALDTRLGESAAVHRAPHRFADQHAIRRTVGAA